MNVRIFWVRAMKCMCAQTRPRFMLSSERVFGGMEFEPMLTPREKSPLPENVPRGGSNPRRCGQRAQALPTELFRPPCAWWVLDVLNVICTQLHPGHMIVHVGDSLQHSEEIVTKNLELCLSTGSLLLVVLETVLQWLPSWVPCVLEHVL